MTLPIIDLESCLYEKNYCEENIWHLCNKLDEDSKTKAFVAFISNPQKTIPLFCQKAGRSENTGMVVWDYHVILVLHAGKEAFVYDFDTTLPFPIDFATYFSQCITNDSQFKQRYQRYFRVCSAIDYLQYFASSREHMKKADGSWISPPPQWSIINNEFSDNNLNEFWNMTHDSVSSTVSNISHVYNSVSICEKFAQK